MLQDLTAVRPVLELIDAIGEVTGYKILDLNQSKLNLMPISAMYSASSCGVSSSNQFVYTASNPYLQSVVSPFDTDFYIKKYGGDGLYGTVQVKFADLKAQLERNLGSEVVFSGTGPYGSPLYATDYDGGEGRYVKYINATYGSGVKIKGKAVRDAVNKLGISMRSHAFAVEGYDADTDMLTLKTMGHGHGLGMSQYGAVGLANEAGWNYQQILKHYYSITSDSSHQLVAPNWD